MKKAMRLILALALAAFLIGGCVSKETTQTGFLEDYSNLKKGPEGGVNQVYKKPGVNFGKYNKVMIDKVSFYLKKDSEAKGLRAHELKKLSDAFDNELIAALNDAYPMVGKPGSDTLRIRIALTDVVSSNPTMGTVGAILPIGMAANLISNVATGESMNVGSASLEAEFVDSVSNQVVASVIDRKVGSTYDTSTVKGEWGHTEKAFKEWAKMLRKWLDDVR
jgi:hypothetical protein